MKPRRHGCWILAALVIASPVVVALGVGHHEERREQELAQALEDEEREVARPIERPVLRGEPIAGEVLRPLGEILARAPQTKFRIQPQKRRGSPLALWRLDAVPRFEGPLEACALFTRVALQAGACEDVNPTTFELARLGVVSESFELEAWKTADGGHPLLAAQLLLDRIRFHHDLARRAFAADFVRLLGDSRRTCRDLATLLPLTDAAGLDEIVREVQLLEATFPSYAEALRRDRLDRTRAFLETIAPPTEDARGEIRIGHVGFWRALELRETWKTFEAENAAMLACEAEARLPLSRALALEGRAEPPPRGFLRRVVNPPPPPAGPRVARKRPRSLELDRERGTIAAQIAPALERLAAVEAAARAESEWLRTHAWPKATSVLDPLCDRPFVLVAESKGGLGVATAGIPGQTVTAPLVGDDEAFLLEIPPR